MLKRHNQILITVIFLLDLLLAYVAWELAYYLRFFWLNFPFAEVTPSHSQYLKAVAVLLVLTGIVFTFTGVYHSHRVARLSHGAIHLIKACFWLFITLLAMAFFYRKFSYSRIHMIYFMGTFLVLLILLRGLVQMVLRTLHKRGWHTRNIAIIGTSQMVDNFVETLRRYRHAGMILKGRIGLPNQVSSDSLKNLSYLGNMNDIDAIVAKYKINQVFIALSNDEKTDLSHLYDVLFDQMVDVKIIPDLGPFKQMHTDVESFDDIPIVTIIQSPLDGWNAVLKRLLDFWGALVAIVLFSPVMLIISVLIKLTSPGPILFKQERMGLDGVTFQTLKFRSMRVDAESRTGAVWARPDDDRRTLLGTVLRKTSLDELPQLFNILKGEMSMVGPRPERPVFIRDFKNKIPHYMLRHKVKAGLTGWAQINGWRGNTSLEKRIECDLYYIEHWSLWFDIKILVITIFKGFINPHAY
ncbi:MAG: undecaprenyl-phosphate glucose phosphotransferase [SAR324 cluster bacterium]|nr:undecaprenyl-phosphate glucose phosphotransferase [SAR324 cluster bacterium]